MPVKKIKRLKPKKQKTTFANSSIGTLSVDINARPKMWNDTLKVFTADSKKPTYEQLVQRIDALYSENLLLLRQADDYRDLIKLALKRN